jgi:hypothetical protein
MAEYGVRQADGSVWIYDDTGQVIRKETWEQNQGLPALKSPEQQMAEAYMSSTAQKTAYDQAVAAADQKYKETLATTQNEQAARSAGIQAGSESLSTYLNLIQQYGGNIQGMDVVGLKNWLMGTGEFPGLPSGPTLEERKFEAELQANPRDIFKAAYYMGGATPPSGFGAAPGTTAGMPGGGSSMGGAYAAGGMTPTQPIGPGGAPATGAGVSLQQAQQELVQAAGGQGWGGGTFGPNTPGYTNPQQTNSDPQSIADAYYRMTGKTVQGYAPPQAGANPLPPGVSIVGFQRAGQAGDMSAGAQQLWAKLSNGSWMPSPSLETLAGMYGWKGGATGKDYVGDLWAQFGNTSNWGDTSKPYLEGGSVTNGIWTPANMQASGPASPSLQPGAGGGTSQTSGLAGVPTYQQLGSCGSSGAFPYNPAVPLPQPNQVPLNWYTQQSPFNKDLVSAAYSTAGLDPSMYQDKFNTSQQAFGGTA